jgi:lipopolysaccharide assembly LptE-like protein
VKRAWLTAIFYGCALQLAALSGCGYQWRSPYREDIKTVAVPVFVNRTYYRGLEVTLSQAVIEDIETHTPYKVVPKERADTILEGEITAAKTATLGISPQTALPQEQEFDVEVSFTWKNLRTGQIMVQRKNFDEKASYYPTLGEDPSVGSQSAVEKLALSVVQELQADW